MSTAEKIDDAGGITPERQAELLELPETAAIQARIAKLSREGKWWKAGPRIDELMKLGLCEFIRWKKTKEEEEEEKKPRHMRLVGTRKGDRYAAIPNSPPSIVPVLAGVDARDIVEAEYHWLWPGIIPGADVSVIMGEPGLGKSTFCSMLAALVSAGVRWPYAPAAWPRIENGRVLIFQSEENLGSVHRPRLTRMGADLSKVRFIKGVENGAGRPRPFKLGRDIASFEKGLDAFPDAKLVIFDPVASFLDEGVMKDEVAFREILISYTILAQERRIAILFLLHLNKDEEKSAINRASGTNAPVQVARMAWFLSAHPDQPNYRCLTLVKGNGEDLDARGIAFGLEAKKITWAKERVEMRAQDVLEHLALNRRLALQAITKVKSGPPPTARAEATAFLLEILGNGPVGLTEAKQGAKDRKIAPGTFNRALDQLVADNRVEKVALGKKQFQIRLRPATGTALVRLRDLFWRSLPGLGYAPLD